MYSIDMIKLKSYPDLTDYFGRIDNTFFNNNYEPIISCLVGFSEYLQLKEDDLIKYWSDSRYKSYRHNWTLSFKDGNSCYIGYQHNAEKTENKHQLYIKYNPGKIHLDIPIYSSLKRLVKQSKPLNITEVDIAVDVERSINNLVIEKPKYIENYKYFNIDNVPTHYYGTRKNLIKVYDKAAELGLKNGYPLTRIEFTLPIKSNRLNKNDIRDITIFDLGGMQIAFDEEKIDKTLNAIVYAILNGYDINRLSRRYQDKIKKYLHSAGTLVDINKDLMLKSFYEYYQYLLELQLVPLGSVSNLYK